MYIKCKNVDNLDTLSLKLCFLFTKAYVVVISFFNSNEIEKLKKINLTKTEHF